jgi:excisionase family DNA binding protein
MKYITVKEYADEYGCSPQYIRKLIKEKKLAAIKVHERLWLISDTSAISSDTLDERLAEANLLNEVRKSLRD